MRASRGTPLAESLYSTHRPVIRRLSWPKRGRSQDRAKVAGAQRYETSYEAKKPGASPAEVRTAVKGVGNSRTKVERKLEGRKGPKRAGASVAW